MKNNSKKVALILLEIGAVVFSKKKPFKFDSGIISPVYVDNRLLISYPKHRQLIATRLAETINKRFPKTEVIAGTATAGIPHAAWVSQILKLPMVYVRSKAKDHGKENQTEGKIEKGQKVVIVEDLISTGGSSIRVAKALKKVGAKVLGVIAIYSHNLKDAELNFTKAKLPIYFLTTTLEVANLGFETGYLSKIQVETVKRWLDDPKNWQK